MQITLLYMYVHIATPLSKRYTENNREMTTWLGGGIGRDPIQYCYTIQLGVSREGKLRSGGGEIL